MIDHDTIAAISTPIGEGGIGIVRISGQRALEIAKGVLRSAKGLPFDHLLDHRLYYGNVINPETDQFIDEALFFYARKPHSFTAEDTVEIQAHGGVLGVSKILEAVLKNGARLAEPGEFTKRAFLNGRIDLVQAESIIDLIRAKSEKAHQIALKQLTGQATKQIQQLEEALYHILISIEAVLDFPEEGIPEPQKEKLLEQIKEIINSFQKLLANADEGRKIRDGLMVVIAGRPNVGKSSLLNAFLEEERAIVTEIPGTTRDVIEAQLQLEGTLIRLIDTAGIRETANPIERMGIKKAEEYLGQADLIIFILDSSKTLTEEDRMIAEKVRGRRVLKVLNKTDLPQKLNIEELNPALPGDYVRLSLLTKEGLDVLKRKIVELVGLGALQIDDRPLLSRIRHKQALEKGLQALVNVQQGLETGLSEDLLAVDLRSSLEALGEITGKKVSDEVIHGIFAQFCIGK